MILIIEDDYDLGFVLKKLFSKIFKDECFVTSKLKDAFLCVCSDDVILILSDLDLGFESGTDFIRKLRLIKPHSTPPIVAFTGLTPEDKRFKEASWLCDAVYQKGSVSAGELCKQIFQLLT